MGIYFSPKSLWANFLNRITELMKKPGSTRKWIDPLPSELFPNFPLCQLHLCYDGAEIKGSYLLNLCVVADCVFMNLKHGGCVMELENGLMQRNESFGRCAERWLV